MLNEITGHLKIDIDTYKEKIQSGDANIRRGAIREWIENGDSRQLDILATLLLKSHPGNTLDIAIRAFGNSRNEHGTGALIKMYGAVTHRERKLIVESLLKSGAFRHFFPGNQSHPNIMRQVWPLVFACNSEQLNAILSLKPAEFKEKLESAWKTTSHWRKK